MLFDTYSTGYTRRDVAVQHTLANVYCLQCLCIHIKHETMYGSALRYVFLNTCKAL